MEEALAAEGGGEELQGWKRVDCDPEMEFLVKEKVDEDISLNKIKYLPFCARTPVCGRILNSLRPL